MAGGDDQDDSQKTEEPTQRRIEESRKRGQVALSREVNSWLMILTATILIAALAPGVMADIRDSMVTYISQADLLPGAPGGLKNVFGTAFLDILKALLLPLIILIIAAIAGPFLQVGPLLAVESIKPDLSKISPLKGIKRLFSKKALMEFLKGVLKIALIGTIGVILLYPFFGQMDSQVGQPMPILLDNMHALVIRLLIGVVIALLVLAAIDLAFQRQEHHQQLRMTKQELKDEYRQSEGDPHVKARLRSLRQQRARQRMMQAVPSADVVITNPTHFAIALKYDTETMDAPMCVAKGIDETALRIRKVATESDVEVVENKPLARALYDTVEIDQTIPPEHYRAVAQIISFVFRKKGHKF